MKQLQGYSTMSQAHFNFSLFSRTSLLFYLAKSSTFSVEIHFSGGMYRIVSQVFIRDHHYVFHSQYMFLLMSG